MLDRATLTARGPDAAEYLQSMLSNDVSEAAPGGAAYALLLTPKARVIADLELFNTGDELVLACDPIAPRRRAGHARALAVPPQGRARAERRTPSSGATPTMRWRPWTRRSAPTGWSPSRRPTVATRRPGRRRASRPASRGTVASSTATRCRRRRGWTSARSASARAATRVRSRSRGCTTAAIRTAGVRGLWFPGDAPPAGLGRRRARREARGAGHLPGVSPRHGSIALAVLRREVPDGAEVDAGGVAGVVKALPFGAAMRRLGAWTTASRRRS